MSTESEFWAKHIEAITNEGIHTKGYAEREGLDVSKLYKWRKGLSDNNNGSRVSTQPSIIPDAETPGPLSQFIRVNTPANPTRFDCQLELPSGLRLNLSSLPDPQWLISLNSNLHSIGRA